MSLVDGVGGAFVFSAEPARLARWYEEHLGIRWATPGPPHYVQFWARADDDPSRRVDTTLSIMTLKAPQPPRAEGPEKTDPADMYGDQVFMVNLRVRDMDTVVARLVEKGTRILARQDEPYGRFAWVRDADGNRVELYQPLEHPP